MFAIYKICAKRGKHKAELLRHIFHHFCLKEGTSHWIDDFFLRPACGDVAEDRSDRRLTSAAASLRRSQAYSDSFSRGPHLYQTRFVARKCDPISKVLLPSKADLKAACTDYAVNVMNPRVLKEVIDRGDIKEEYRQYFA